MNSTNQCHQLCPYPCHQHCAIHPGQESIPGLVNHDWMIDWHKFRVWHCDWLVANVTKNWALVTRNLELVASRQLTFFPLHIWNSKVNGLFLKENTKLPWTIVVKQSDNLTITIFTRRHIVSKPFHLATKIFRLVASWLP